MAFELSLRVWPAGVAGTPVGAGAGRGYLMSTDGRGSEGRSFRDQAGAEPGLAAKAEGGTEEGRGQQ